MKALYINRMNFLRNEIYKHLGLEMMNKPAFMYVNQFLPLDTLRKVGMLDMFPLGLRYMMIFLPIPIFVIAYNILKLLGVSVHWLTFFVPPIFVVLVMWYTKRAWVNIVRDTKDKIEKSWKSLDEG